MEKQPTEPVVAPAAEATPASAPAAAAETAPAAAAPKKKKTGLIVGIIIFLVLAIAGGVTAAILLLNKKPSSPEEIINNAADKIFNGEEMPNIAIDGKVKVNIEYSGADATISAVLGGTKAKANVKGTFDMGSDKLTVDVDAVVDGQKVYAKVNKLSSDSGYLFDIMPISMFSQFLNTWLIVPTEYAGGLASSYTTTTTSSCAPRTEMLTSENILKDISTALKNEKLIQFNEYKGDVKSNKSDLYKVSTSKEAVAEFINSMGVKYSTCEAKVKADDIDFGGFQMLTEFADNTISRVYVFNDEVTVDLNWTSPHSVNIEVPTNATSFEELFGGTSGTTTTTYDDDDDDDDWGWLYDDDDEEDEESLQKSLDDASNALTEAEKALESLSDEDWALLEKLLSD